MITNLVSPKPYIGCGGRAIVIGASLSEHHIDELNVRNPFFLRPTPTAVWQLNNILWLKLTSNLGQICNTETVS